MKSYNSLTAYDNFKKNGNASLSSGISGIASASSLSGFAASSALTSCTLSSLPALSMSTLTSSSSPSLSFNHSNKPSALSLPSFPVIGTENMPSLTLASQNPTGILLSNKATEVKINYLYRGDSRTPNFPDDMHSNGFKTKLFPDHEVIGEIDPYPDTEYIATSKLRSVAKRYPEEVEFSKTYVYKINPQSNGIDLANDRFEIVVPNAIKPHDIKGAWEIDLTLASPTLKETLLQKYGNIPSEFPDISYLDYHRTRGEFIPNPNYKPPLAIRAANAVKAGAHGALAVGVMLDTVSLFKAMDHSMAINNNGPAIKEATRIAAGWSGAAAIGIPLAKASATICAPAGPLASLGCGAVGGLTGSVIGYVGASDLVNATFNKISQEDLNLKISQLKI